MLTLATLTREIIKKKTRGEKLDVGHLAKETLTSSILKSSSKRLEVEFRAISSNYRNPRRLKRITELIVNWELQVARFLCFSVVLCKWGQHLQKTGVDMIGQDQKVHAQNSWVVKTQLSIFFFFFRWKTERSNHTCIVGRWLSKFCGIWRWGYSFLACGTISIS